MTSDAEHSSKHELSSLEKGLAVLQELAAAERGLTAGELARRTGLNRSTVYRLCDTLERGGWIHRPEGERQVLTVGPLLFGIGVLLASHGEARVRTITDELAALIGEAVHVGVLDGANVVHVARSLPPRGMGVAAQLGEREHAHVAALGKVLLATLTDEAVTALFPVEGLAVRTPNTISTRTALIEELHQVRACGYAVDDEEGNVGIKCVAAPVFDASGAAVCALSVTTVPGRLEGERLITVAGAVRVAADRATAALSGRIPGSWPANDSDGPSERQPTPAASNRPGGDVTSTRKVRGASR